MGKAEFAAIPGPSYVSAGVPGRGYRPDNAFIAEEPWRRGAQHRSHQGRYCLRWWRCSRGLHGTVPCQSACRRPGRLHCRVSQLGATSSAQILVEHLPQNATGTTSNGDLFRAATLLVDDWQQCGGTGGEPSSRGLADLPCSSPCHVACSHGMSPPGECTARDRGEPVRPCIPGAWPLAVCRSLDPPARLLRRARSCSSASRPLWALRLPHQAHPARCHLRPAAPLALLQRCRLRCRAGRAPLETRSGCLWWAPLAHADSMAANIA